MYVEIPIVIANPLSNQQSATTVPTNNFSNYSQSSQSNISTSSQASTRNSLDYSRSGLSSINFDMNSFKTPSQTSLSLFNDSDLASLYSSINLTPIAPPKMSIKARKQATKMKSFSLDDGSSIFEKSMAARYSLDEHTPTIQRNSLDSTVSGHSRDILDNLEPYYGVQRIGKVAHKKSKSLLPRIDFGTYLFGHDINNCDMDELLPGIFS